MSHIEEGLTFLCRRADEALKFRRALLTAVHIFVGPDVLAEGHADGVVVLPLPGDNHRHLRLEDPLFPQLRRGCACSRKRLLEIIVTQL